MSQRNPQPVPENADAGSPLAAGSKAHQYYHCLLKQHASKFKKVAPIYQTRNEGSSHLPKFRSEVWFDGKSYTSSNTFRHIRTAEMDVSRVAYLAIVETSKEEAIKSIEQDNVFCKSILVEYATRMNLEKPSYLTTQVNTQILPSFFSSVKFDGVMYQGKNSKNKKDAEQNGARAVIMKYLDSETANEMVEIISNKSRLSDEGANSGIDNQNGNDESTLNRKRKNKKKKNSKKKLLFNAEFDWNGPRDGC